jgi:hypothetical protein
MVLVACFSSWGTAGSFFAIASRTFLIAVLTVERTALLRTRRFDAWRLRFSAERVFATVKLLRKSRAF